MPSQRPRTIVRDAALPRPLGKKISRVVRATRLDRPRRVMVAEALTSEARARLDAGEHPREIAASFGRERRLARQFRRELLPDTSVAHRVIFNLRTWVSRSIAVSVAAFLLTYSFLAWRFHTGEPVLTRNVTAEHNAWLESIDESDTGAAYYREAFASLERLTGNERGTLDRAWPDIHPGDPLWPEALAFLDRNAEALTLIRTGASKPYAGFRLSASPHLHEDSPIDTESNPAALDIILDSLGPYRSFSRTLAVDARAAAEAGDAYRCASDLLSILHMCRHAEEHEVLLGELVSLAMLNVCVTTIGQILTQHPELLTEDALLALDLALRAHMEGDMRADIFIEESFLYDCMQRLYSDDGSGNGYVCAEGMKMLDAIAMGGPGRLGVSGVVLGPLHAGVMPSRAEFRDKYESVLALLDDISKMPMWEWEQEPQDVVETVLGGDRIDDLRFHMVMILMPALGKAVSAHEFAKQPRDAALTLIALTRYRRDHGRNPDSLDALVPEYLSEVPPDRYDGQPIKFRLTEEGFPLLYSVGSDRRDDGGVPRDGDDGGLDASRWQSPDVARQLPPGDWIILPRLRPRPTD